ncbi:MAG TPA: hypothetical protein VK157_02900 [Phycisphaerales bacterium]|nr:hypothetical protein [Phycisphaerales bacterium]
MQSFAARSLVVVLACAGVWGLGPMGVAEARGQIVVRAANRSGASGTTLITTRSVDEYAKLLGLTAEQHETIKTLHEGYRAAWKAADEERESKQEAAQEKMQDGDFEAMNKAIVETTDAFAEKTAKLETQFMEDIKATLTNEQAEKWPAVERHRRRDTRLRMSSYSGAGIDLIRVVDRTSTHPQTSEFSQLLSDYEMAIDRQLVENASRVSSLPKAEDDKVFDPRHQEEVMTVMGENGKALRDLNRDYGKRLAALMPAEMRTKFEAELAKRSFPQVYEATHIEDCIAAASGFSDLDASAKETIAQLKEQWERESQPLNKAWAEAITKAEEESGGSLQLQIRQWSGGGGNAEIKAARDARRELEKRLRSRLDDVLTTAQEERLPAKKKSEAGPGGGIRINIGGGGGASDDEE